MERCVTIDSTTEGRALRMDWGASSTRSLCKAEVAFLSCVEELEAGGARPEKAGTPAVGEHLLACLDAAGHLDLTERPLLLDAAGHLMNKDAWEKLDDVARAKCGGPDGIRAITLSDGPADSVRGLVERSLDALRHIDKITIVGRCGALRKLLEASRAHHAEGFTVALEWIAADGTPDRNRTCI